MLNLHHAQGLFTAGTDIRPNADLIQDHPGVFRRYWIVVNHQNMQRMRIYRVSDLLNALIAVPQGDRHGKFCTNALLRLYADRTVHHLDDPLRNRHTQTRAAIFCRVASVFLGKGLEDLGNKSLIHAYAGIADAEAKGGLILKDRCALYAHRNAAGRLGEFDSIRQDIDQHFLELHIISDIIHVH